MKKYLLFVITLLIPVFVLAAEPEFKISCPTGAALNSEITCKIDIKSEVKIKEVSANYSFGSNFSFVSLTPNSSFQAATSNSSGFTLKNVDGVINSFNLASLKLKFLSAGTLTLSDIKLIDTNDTTYRASSINQPISALSTDNTLKSITLSEGTLNPGFKSSITDYKVEVESENITIKLEANDAKARLIKTINQKLKYGLNNIKIEVTSEAGTKKTYNLAITRVDKRSSNNDLKSLSVTVGSLKFASGTTNYKVNVPKDTTAVAVNAELSDSSSEFVSGFGPRTVELLSDSTVVELKIKSAKGDIKTYTITFLKAESDNTNIKELFIDNYKVDLKDNVYKYDAKVSESAKLEFKVTLEDEKAKYNIINNDLKNGNVVTIKVTAENGSTKDYTFNITKGTVQKVAFFSDFICSDNSYIYYLIVFLLGALLSMLICILVYTRKMRKLKDKYIKMLNQNGYSKRSQNSDSLFYGNGSSNQANGFEKGNTEILYYDGNNR